MRRYADDFMRLWHAPKPTIAHRTYRLGPERAKRMLMTGDLIDDSKAERLIAQAERHT